MRHVLFTLGWLLILIAPFIGVLPGPFGIMLLLTGLALILETSIWAKRAYVRFKRRWPRAGQWCDRGLRRKSERRRRERAKPVIVASGD